MFDKGQSGVTVCLKPYHKPRGKLDGFPFQPRKNKEEFNRETFTVTRSGSVLMLEAERPCELFTFSNAWGVSLTSHPVRVEATPFKHSSHPVSAEL